MTFMKRYALGRAFFHSQFLLLPLDGFRVCHPELLVEILHGPGRLVSRFRPLGRLVGLGGRSVAQLVRLTHQHPVQRSCWSFEKDKTIPIRTQGSKIGCSTSKGPRVANGLPP